MMAHHVLRVSIVVVVVTGEPVEWIGVEAGVVQGQGEERGSTVGSVGLSKHA